MDDNQNQDNYVERIETIYQLRVLDVTVEESLHDLLSLALQITGAENATIAFFEDGGVSYKSRVGFGDLRVAGDFSALLLYLNEQPLLLLKDVRESELFQGITLLESQPGVLFLAASPITSASGEVVGFIAVMDSAGEERPASALSCLPKLGKQIATLLDLGSKFLYNNRKDDSYSITQLAAIFKNDIDSILIMTGNGIIVHSNPKAELLLGWQPDEISGKQFLETVIPERYRKQVKEKMEAADAQLNGDVGNPTVDIAALKKSGREVDIALGISPTFVGEKKYFISYIRNITERILATKKIDEQKAFYENILNKLPTDIAVFDPDHRYLFVNPGAIKDEALRKYIIGKDDFEYAAYRNRDASVAERRRSRFLEVINSDVEIKWEDTLESPDGTPITHLRRLFPVRNKKGKLLMIIGYGIDITERKIMENKLHSLVKQLSAQNTQLVDFCNIVSHNLRAPLVNMSMLVQYIEETEDATDQKELINMLKPVVENLHITFSELVESIQIKQDHEIQSERILLTDCVNRTLEELKMEIGKSQAEFEIDFDEARHVYFPSKYMFSIFHNLLSNALKYQSPDRKPTVKLTTRRTDDSIILSVADNGLGIDMEKHKNNIFKIGKVFHKNTNAKGFGLFMTKTQVEAMGGNIWVESQPDNGATFFIEFKNQK